MNTNTTAFGNPFKKMNLNFTIGNTFFTIIDSAHSTFFNSFPRHFHSFYEFHYIYSGKGILITDFGSFPLEKGDAYMIPPRMYHEQITDEKNFMEEFHIAFEIKKTGKEDSFFSTIEKEGFWLGKDLHNMADLYTRIEGELKERYFGYE